LRAMPSGVVAMSKDLAGLVESSTNLGVVSTKGNEVEILTLARSSVMPALRDMLDAQTGLARLAGIKSEYLGGYPGWKPNMESKVLDVTRKAYARLFGHEAGITAIHAGLECGLIGERIHGMDMVSFGPLLVGVHAPNEKVSIPSAQKFWKLLGAVLDDLSA
ncbi:MAG: cytosol nonspecific dipeptidase, partial [Candidatus Polarisedimenticolia bacterium]